MNRAIVLIGEKIHDALRHFSRVSNKDWIRCNLEGGCAVGSYFFVKELEKVGIEATLIVGNRHCWVESDNYIYDVTATQYTVQRVGDVEREMDRAEKVRVVDRAVVRSFRTDYATTPRHLWSIEKYRSRIRYNKSELDTSVTTVSIRFINHFFPQGQRLKGYCLETENDSFRLYWKGKYRTIGI